MTAASQGDAQSGDTERAAAPPRIATVALVSRNRVEPMMRALTSYVENAVRHGRRAEFAVVDDSESAATRDTYREVLRAVQQRHGLGVVYAGLEEKRRFARRLVGEGHVPPSVVDFALFGAEGCRQTYGANRNALLLHGVGDLVFSADDDTICQVGTAPQPAPGVACVAGRDPAEYWFFPDREATLRAVDIEDRDILALHEMLLGRRSGAILPRPSPDSAPAADEASPSLRRLRSPATTVAVTFNGLFGDCGWGAPFGWWNAPLGYLLLDDASHERLVRSAPEYRSACTSRELLRVVRRPTLSDAACSMSTFAGFDHRRPLPPFMPVQRGSDIIFGATLWRCCGDRCAGHVPAALLHDPVPARRFAPGEIVRTASGFDTAKMILLCLAEGEADCDGPEAGDSMVATGRRLMEIGGQSAPDFAAFLRERMAGVNERLAAQLEDRLGACGATPAFWASDVRRYVSILRQATRRDDYAVPLDLVDGRGFAEARVLAQHLVVKFGELLCWWPAMVETARQLRDRGERLATPACSSSRIGGAV